MNENDLTGFFQLWEKRHPELGLYTCWRQAKRLARSFHDLETWLRPEMDKISVVAPGLLELTKNANELELLERTVNGDIGVRCVRHILLYLRRGAPEAAKSVRQSESDKTRSYPEFEPVLYRMFGCTIHGVQGCDGWLCRDEDEKADPR